MRDQLITTVSRKIMNEVDSEDSMVEDDDPAEASGPYMPEGMNDFSEEEAHMLLDELQDLVIDLEPGAVERDEAVREDVDRLLAGLESLEVPVSAGSATPEAIASWTRVLAGDGAHDEQGGPEEIRGLLNDQIDQLRRLMDREPGTARGDWGRAGPSA